MGATVEEGFPSGIDVSAQYKTYLELLWALMLPSSSEEELRRIRESKPAADDLVGLTTAMTSLSSRVVAGVPAHATTALERRRPCGYGRLASRYDLGPMMLGRPLMIPFFLLAPMLLLGQPQADSKTVAKVQGQVITADELQKAAGGDLARLQMERQQILEATLNRLITEKVLDLEASSRRITRADLLKQEVDAKVTEPTPQETNQIYEVNKARIKDPPEKVIPKIRESLIGQQKQTLYARLVERLKAKYEVRTFLEPLRIPVKADGLPSRGPADAPVTLVVFSDFECPYCASLNTTLNKVMAESGDRIRLVYRQFPLDQIHPHAAKAAEASLCAEEQGRFWEMHDAMFKGPIRLELDELKAKAAAIGLDPRRFDSCLSSGKYAERVRADVEAGKVAGVASTPTLFINGRPVLGAQPYQEIARIIEEERARAK
jgi:protein-disulfide isomerase